MSDTNEASVVSAVMDPCFRRLIGSPMRKRKQVRRTADDYSLLQTVAKHLLLYLVMGSDSQCSELFISDGLKLCLQ